MYIYNSRHPDVEATFYDDQLSHQFIIGVIYLELYFTISEHLRYKLMRELVVVGSILIIGVIYLELYFTISEHLRYKLMRELIVIESSLII